MYRAAALAMRRGDPDATVGGPALAFSHNWIEPFARYVEANQLPLDFFSYHSIGGGDQEPSKEEFALAGLKAIRQALRSSRYFQNTDIHLNEYHPYHGAQSGASDSPALAARMLDDFAMFLVWTDVTVVNWAQFSDPGMVDAYGLLDVNGNPRPAYGAFAIYADMPIDRVKAASEKGISCMASTDERCAGIVLWNTQSTTQDIVLRAEHVPFAHARFGVYRIDALHRVVAKDRLGGLVLAPCESWRRTAQEPLVWRGKIPGNAVVYLKLLNDATLHTDGSSISGNVIRIQRCFGERDGGSEYGFFDSRNWQARLGMGENPKAPAQLTVTAENLPKTLNVSFAPGGSPGIISQGLVKMWFNYHTSRGNDPAIRIGGDAKNTACVDLAKNAPKDWDGRISITFFLTKSAPGTAIRISLSSNQEH